MKKVAIIMGSDSDLKGLQGAMDTLKALEIPYAVRIISAHRTPEAAAEFARNAQAEGYGVIIAAATDPVTGWMFCCVSVAALTEKLVAYRAAQTEKVLEKDARISAEYSNL